MNVNRLTEIQESAFDKIYGTSAIIQAEHRMIHQGKSYTVSDVQYVATTSMAWQITTPAGTEYAHMVVDAFCTGEMQAVLTEGSDKTDGTALVEINRNRNVTTASTVIVTRTPTDGTTVGATVLRSSRNGSTGVASKTVSASDLRASSEFILKPATKYVLTVTTYADVYVTFRANWYVA